MTWRGLKAAMFALLLIVVNTHCLVACSSEPCHNGFSRTTQEAKPPSCHQEHPQPRQDHPPQRCEHAPLVADSHSPAKFSADLDPVRGPVVLPVEAAIFPGGGRSHESTIHETSPPIVPAYERTAILRI